MDREDAQDDADDTQPFFYVRPLHPHASMANPGTDPDLPWTTLEAVLATARTFPGGAMIMVDEGWHGVVHIQPRHRDDGWDRVTIAAFEGSKPLVEKLHVAPDTGYWTIQGLAVSVPGTPSTSSVPPSVPSLVPGRPRGIVLDKRTQGVVLQSCTVQDDPDAGIHISGSHHAILRCSVVRAGGIVFADDTGVNNSILHCLVQGFAWAAGLTLNASVSHVVGCVVAEAAASTLSRETT